MLDRISSSFKIGLM